VIVAGILGVLMALAAGAWACTVHTGTIWFCKSSSNTNCSSGQSSSTWDNDQSLTGWANGASLLVNSNYQMKYADDSSATECMNGTNWGSPFNTDSGGNFSSVEGVFPSTPDVYDFCALKTTDTEQASNHKLITIVD
jgi:hypothetical protein